MPPLLAPLLDLLFPRPCLACGTLIAGAGELGLCTGCAAKLRPAGDEEACGRCGVATPSGRLCAPCALEPPPFARFVALWRYEPPVRELLHAFKFRRLDYLGAPIGYALGQRYLEASAPTALAFDRCASADRALPDLVVPVPLAWPRRFARGYNQTELLAAGVAKAIGRPARRRLRRRLSFGHQTGRSRIERLAGTARSAGSAGVRPSDFRPLPLRPVAGLSLLLVDDVTTTGATTRAAAAALLGAGARRVEIAVAARTPRLGPI